jgi:hypothetical protein
VLFLQEFIVPSEIRDIDLGWKKIKKQLKLANNSYTKVGIQSDAGKNEESDNASIAEYATYNEYGTGSIPARPFMRSTFDMFKDKVSRLKKEQYELILQGKRTVRRSLALIGEFMEGRIKRRITAIGYPRNKPSTIKKKKSSNPLIDTGVMRQSIRHVEVLKR